MKFHSFSQTTTRSKLNWLLTEGPSVDFAGLTFSQIFLLHLLCAFPQPWHGDAAALLPAGASECHHGADRQHLGWKPLQVHSKLLVTKKSKSFASFRLSTPAMIYHLLTGCTGYRPILDAFKKFGSDAPGAKTRVAGLVADIEDLGLGGGSGICKRTGKVKEKIVREKKAYLLLQNQITLHRWLILSFNKYSQSLLIFPGALFFPFEIAKWICCSFSSAHLPFSISQSNSIQFLSLHTVFRMKKVWPLSFYVSPLSTSKP